ncbi:type II toxin-antitoxin system RelE/ParE family toxin [Aggregatibacter actinomycetemcomitans]|nr:type II toxin-antitoxin system RelE/ParE family toxin [Aggregatibacter actinomycetemcomitans]
MLPKCGKIRNDTSGTREIFARSYRVVYLELDDYVQIVAVVHSRRLYPKS